MRKVTFFDLSKRAKKKHDTDELIDLYFSALPHLERNDKTLAIVHYLFNLKSLEDYSDDAVQKAYHLIRPR